MPQQCHCNQIIVLKLTKHQESDCLCWSNPEHWHSIPAWHMIFSESSSSSHFPCVRTRCGFVFLWINSRRKRDPPPSVSMIIVTLLLLQQQFLLTTVAACVLLIKDLCFYLCALLSVTLLNDFFHLAMIEFYKVQPVRTVYLNELLVVH